MDYKKYYTKNKTYITRTDFRLKKIIEKIENIRPENILDIGCGSGYLLNELSRTVESKLSGVDIYKNKKSKKWNYKVADITKGLPYKNKEFDSVICGEVIEHVPNPDFLLKEINRVMSKNGILIISTPNLVSWANRLLVPLGIQPLFTETSSEVNLGRHFRVLGQGGKVQGHLKIFTYNSLSQILEREKFEVIDKNGATFFFPFPISLVDKFFINFPSLASNLIFTCKKK